MTQACKKRMYEWSFTMSIDRTGNVVQLSRDALLPIRAEPGQRLVCVRGRVWITQDGDPRDIVLSAGDHFVLDRPGTTLVNALEGDAVIVRQARSHVRSVARPARSDVRLGSFVEALDTFRPDCDPDKLAAMPSGARNAIVEEQARQLRSAVAGFILRHALRTLTDSFVRLKQVVADVGASTALRRTRYRGRA